MIKLGKDADIYTLFATAILSALVVAYNVYRKNIKKSNVEELWKYELIAQDRTMSKMISDKLKLKNLDVITGENYTGDVNSILKVEVKAHTKEESRIILDSIPKGVRVNRYPIESFIKK